ncbi:MAG: acetate--CoA ligase family protein [Planctomycetes bacterium]|nr:acetate--CoA ligase family protein [Planctomycetota bacterium]
MARTQTPPRAPKRATDPAHSLDAVFRPRSVAVIGASKRRLQIGHQIVRNLVEGDFQGPVYPVNPKATVVHSMHCYPRVSAIPGEVDLALLVVPAPHVVEAARDCGEKGVKALVCITAGFAEIGGEGAQRQAELLEVCRAYGMRLIGPNCMGVLNTEEGVSMNASFADARPTRGEAAFLSQSGALGAAILADAKSLGLGISMFASVGNRADVSPADLLEYWHHDPNSKQILMYLEAFGEPEQFMKIARRVSREKPILVVKSGRTARGARAAVSHTGSLAGSEVAVDSLLEQCGVLRVDSMEDLFGLAGAVQTGKLPAGNRVAIVTNAGGPGILATDACVSQGLRLSDLDPKTRRAIEKVLPPEASSVNPIDLIASAGPEAFDKVLGHVLADPAVDMVLAIFVAPIMIDARAVAEVFAKHAAATAKPFLSCLPGKGEGEDAVELLHAAGVPNYRFPEEAAGVLSGLVRLRGLRDRPSAPAPEFKVQKKKARALVEGALAEGRTSLDGDERAELAAAYGLCVVPSKIVSSRDEALRAVKKLGFPMVAKVVAAGIEHKSDKGGVILDVRNREELLEAYDLLEERFLDAAPDMQVQLQAMRSEGVETFFGAATDPGFGRMLAFGLGGIHVEILRDVVFRLHPLTPTDAAEMIEHVRGKKLLEGARGKPPVDKQELIDVLLRLSQMLTDVPEIVELDLNPYLAGYRGEGSCILDMRLVLAPHVGERQA